MKVIYVSFVHLSDKTSRDWHIDYLISQGVTVEYWDVVSLVIEEYEEAAAKSADYLRVLRTYDELEALLQLPENRDAYYVTIVTYAEFSIRLYRMLTKYDCKLIYIMWGAVPVNPLNRWIRLSRVFSNPLSVAGQLYNRQKAILYRKLKLVKPFDIIFAGGEVMMANSGFSRKMVPINSGDFEQYRQVKRVNPAPLVDGRCAVFLDVYLTHHADNKVCGWSMIGPDAYFATLNRFFARLEEKFGVEVVIAAHPRADYRTVNPFNGRRIFQNRTPELVKDSVFVISHSSLSQSQAVLNHKPIIFVYTNEMMSIYKHTYVNEIYDVAAYLNAALYNIDEVTSNDQIVLKDVDPARYEKYKYSFLVSRDSEHKSTQEIFLDTLTTVEHCGEGL